jgi:trehalose-6-phosphate synthase/uncharacterized membrane protein affecting hemolysin expression
MRFNSRLIISLILCIMPVALIFTYFQVRSEERSLRNELERHSAFQAEVLAETASSMLEKGSSRNLQRTIEKFASREHLAGIAVYDERGNTLAITPDLQQHLKTRPEAAALSILTGEGRGEFFTLDHNLMHIYALPLHRQEAVVGTVAIFRDAGGTVVHTKRMWIRTFLRVSGQLLLIALFTLLIVRWSMVGPVAKTAQWIRNLRTHGSIQALDLPDEELFRPLVREVTHLAKSLALARAAAEEEARLREASEAVWTAERLRIHVQSKLQGSSLFVVSNREPYMHVHKGKLIQPLVPASGLVTALEPILRACDGTWIAHGGGDADRETVDDHDRLRVPPEDPQYSLRRVWLTKEEEEGYYFGFANEGLWPLCHIAHTRPVFRVGDWEHYQKANKKFAEAVVEEMAGAEHPAVFVQDYHFALLPRLIKKERPDARVAVFWHIPWPNPEAFGICPWQRELLDGLLGADLLGFHIQSHCNNFLETVDNALESRIDWERFAVNRLDHLTLVRPFPISVEFKEAPEGLSEENSPYLERMALFKELGIEAAFMGVGVDRVDYTKGILERFRGIERFLEKNSNYRGQFSFVQIGAPSRTHIKQYHDLLAEVEAEAERINWRFQSGNWKPIVYLKKHHSHQEIDHFYRAADVCIVSSLHDGMNLVAKEFVGSRQDEEGALILSRFTGACRELRDAVVVNPYDTEQMADAILYALRMQPEERKTRMQRMRRVVKEHNVYRWAANVISELCEIRLEKHELAVTKPTTSTV